MTPFIVLIFNKERVHKRTSLTMVNTSGYIFFEISNRYLVVKEDSQVLLFGNGF